MTRRRVIEIALASGLALLMLEPRARAQSRAGFAVNHFEPAERGSDWLVVDSLDFRGHLRPTAGTTADYVHKPLVVYDAAENERSAPVRHQAIVHLGAALVLFERVRLGLDVPAAVYQDGEAAVVRGETLKAATAPAMGDIRLAADVRLVGQYAGPFSVALGLRAWVPSGVPSQLTGDGAARLSPQALVSGTVGVLSWAGRVAFVHRWRDDAYAGSTLGSEVAFALGAGVTLGRFSIGPEVFAASKVTGGAFLGADGSPADAVLGVHYHHASGVRLGAALGTGLTRGYGSPAARALLSVEWGAAIHRSTMPDRDGDGIADATDACPEWPGIASGDPEQNGCPRAERVAEEDTDADGIWDLEDACPGLAGRRTSDPMTHGCPPDAPKSLAVVTLQEIRIGEQVRFATDSAELLAESDALLGEVKHVLDEHPEILRLRIEGHTDDTGTTARNEELSARRAEAVMQWLVDRGVDPKRLESNGYGSRHPVDSNATESGRSNNRRVVFTIVVRAPKH